MSMLAENNGGCCKKRYTDASLAQHTRTSQIQELIKEQECFRKTTQALVEATESLKKEVALFHRDFNESRKSVLVDFFADVWKVSARRYQKTVRLHNRLMENDWFRWVVIFYIGCSLGTLLRRVHYYIIENDFDLF